MLDELREYQRKIFKKNDISYERYFHNTIDMNQKLIGIVGARDNALKNQDNFLAEFISTSYVA